MFYMDYSTSQLGKIIKHQRIKIPLTMQELAALSKVSSSHLGRIERGERFPSARILRKIAKPLGFNEDELFTLADFSPRRPPAAWKKPRRGTPATSSTLTWPKCSAKSRRKCKGLLSVY